MINTEKEELKKNEKDYDLLPKEAPTHEEIKNLMRMFCFDFDASYFKAAQMLGLSHPSISRMMSNGYFPSSTQRMKILYRIRRFRKYKGE